jgi:hypothetical protein
MKRMKRVAQRGETKKPGAVRLTFSYKGEALELIKQQSLEMIPPPSDELEVQKEASGFWVEISDAKRNVLYRRATDNPIRHYAEVRSDDPDRPLAMQEVKDPSGIFTILVPDILEAAEVALFSSPFEEKKRLLPAVEIARFELRGRKERRQT